MSSFDRYDGYSFSAGAAATRIADEDDLNLQVGIPAGVSLPAAETAELQRFILAAEDWLVARTNRSLYTQSCTLKVSRFPTANSGFLLPRVPLLSVTSIVYVDPDGAVTTAAGSLYDVGIAREPGRITLAYGQAWPAYRLIADGIVIQYATGYTTPPVLLKQAVLMLSAHFYEHRSATTAQALNTVPLAVESSAERYSAADEFARHFA